jgi:hypothetical protein
LPVRPKQLQPSCSSTTTTSTATSSTIAPRAPPSNPAAVCLLDRCDQHDHRGICSKSGCPYAHVCAVATRSGECPREHKGCPWIHPCPFGAACPHLAGAPLGTTILSMLWSCGSKTSATDSSSTRALCIENAFGRCSCFNPCVRMCSCLCARICAHMCRLRDPHVLRIRPRCCPRHGDGTRCPFGCSGGPLHTHPRSGCAHV